jgi:hypothetical protein
MSLLYYAIDRVKLHKRPVLKRPGEKDKALRAKPGTAQQKRPNLCLPGIVRSRRVSIAGTADLAIRSKHNDREKALLHCISPQGFVFLVRGLMKIKEIIR